MVVGGITSFGEPGGKDIVYSIILPVPSITNYLELIKSFESVV